jgi:PAS domain S-box-containing protein
LEESLVRRLRFFSFGYFVVVALTVAAVLPFAIVTSLSVSQRINELFPAQHSATSLLTAATDQESAERGYVITGNDAFLLPYRAGEQATAAAETDLARRDLPRAERDATSAAVSALSRWRREAAVPEIAATAAGDRAGAEARVAAGTGKRLFDEFRADQSRLADLIEARVRLSNESLRTFSLLVIVALVVATVLGTIFGFLFRAAGRRVAAQEDARARALADAAALTKSVIEATGDPIFAKDLEGRYTITNSATAHALRSSSEEIVGRPSTDFVAPEIAAVLRANDQRVIETGVEESFNEMIDTPEGVRHFISRKAPLRDAAGNIVGTVGVARDLTESFAAADALAQAAGLQETIAAVTAAMAAGRTITDVAQAAVVGAAESVGAPFGSLRVVDEASGRWQYAATFGVIEELNREWQPYAEDVPVPMRIVLRTRQTLTVTKDDFARHYPGIVDTTAALGVDAIVYAPVFHAGAVSAVMTIGLGEDEREFVDTARAVLEALGPIVGQALERARLFEANQSVAVTLQRALLEHVPLDDDRVAVAARYLPAAEDTLVGGDWYDVVALRRDRIALIVGDIVGHGVGAAAAMGQLRSALTAVVGAVDDLSVALEYFEREARRNAGGISATCLVLILDPGRHELEYVSAGHPPALLLSPGGGAVYLDEAQGPPLAISDIDRRRPVGRHRFEVGSTVLLYTDGLIERRQESIDVGLDRLRRAAESNDDGSVDLLCDRILEQLLASHHNRDDVALVAARLERADSQRFTRHIADDPSAITSVRHELETWLARQDVPAELVEAVLVGASEAMTNSFEHAYPVAGGGAIVLHARCHDYRLEISVRDHGKWRQQKVDPTRGRGLAVMRELADDLTVRPQNTGTSVTLVYRLQHRHG